MNTMDRYRAAVMSLAMSGCSAPDAEARDLGMCISAVLIASVVDKIAPRGFQGRMVKFCSTFGDEAKAALSEYMTIGDADTHAVVLERSQERLASEKEGNHIKKYPAHPVSSKLLADLDEAREPMSSEEEMVVLQDLIIAIGLRMDDLRV
jgi:hypothetical protein